MFKHHVLENSRPKGKPDTEALCITQTLADAVQMPQTQAPAMHMPVNPTRLERPKTPSTFRVSRVPATPSPRPLDPNQYVQTLDPPLFLAQKTLDPLVHRSAACLLSHALDRARDQRSRRLICRLRKNARSLEHRCCSVQGELSGIGERWIEPWRVEVEECDDEDE
jgi:hypothetical protein